MRNRVFMTVAAVAALFTSAAVSAQGKLPPYPEALRCAAATNAAAKIGKGTPEESVLFDQQIYWGMAASDSGRAAGKNGKAVETEVNQQTATFEPQLRSQNGTATAALAACVARVPALDN